MVRPTRVTNVIRPLREGAGLIVDTKRQVVPMMTLKAAMVEIRDPPHPGLIVAGPQSAGDWDVLRQHVSLS